MKDAFPDPPLVSYRRDANLEDILVHKKHNKMYNKKKKLIQGAFHNLIFGKTQTSFALRLFSVYAI